MKILHTFWLPDATDAFRQPGSFRLWVETQERRPIGPDEGVAAHPFHLRRDAWPAFLEALGAKPTDSELHETLET